MWFRGKHVLKAMQDVRLARVLCARVLLTVLFDVAISMRTRGCTILTFVPTGTQSPSEVPCAPCAPAHCRLGVGICRPLHADVRNSDDVGIFLFAPFFLYLFFSP